MLFLTNNAILFLVMKMTTKTKTSGVLSTFTLKILACVFMLIDHVGVRIFPQFIIFRVIGRLAFPIFAFLISQGCYYTKSRLKRFLSVFLLGIICEMVYVIYDGRFYGNILLTFSLSILLIYTLDEIKKKVYSKQIPQIILYLALFISGLILSYIINYTLGVDYGFFGILTPVFVSLCDYKAGEHPEYFKYLDNKPTRLVMLAFALVLLSWRKSMISIQILSLFSLIPISLYNGKVGKYKLKYAFYLFYPLHLLLIEGISMLIK